MRNQKFHAFFTSLLLSVWMVSCAQPRNPVQEFNNVPVIMVCSVSSDGATYTILEVIKCADKAAVKMTPGSSFKVPLIDSESAKKYSMRLIFFGATDPQFMEQLVGPRMEYMIEDGRIDAYGGITVGRYKEIVGNQITSAKTGDRYSP